MIRVLDLFAGTQSVKEALDEQFNVKKGVEHNGIGTGLCGTSLYAAVEYVGIDIYSPEDENIIIDLTSDFSLEMILDRLGDGKPDFIGASPVCKSGSIAAISHHGRVEYEDKKIVNRIPVSDFAKLSVKMVENTKKIVNHFGVPFAIENPRGTLRKHPVFKNYFLDTAMYCQYGDTRMKPTDIGSNKQLNLRKCKNGNPCHIAAPRGSATGTQGLKNNKDRSIVPPMLIKEIIKQLLEVE